MDFESLRKMVCDAIAETECWRHSAREWRALYDGNHWSNKEREWAKEAGQNLLTFNSIPVVVNNITGLEANNRKQISYEAMMPPMMGHNGGPQLEQAEQQLRQIADSMNAALDHFREEADCEDVESEAFRDMIITGLGATETYIDYDEDARGKLRDMVVHRDELIFDSNACQRDLTDAAFVGTVREISAEDGKRMFPGKSAHELDACWVEAGKSPETRDFSEPIERVTIVHIQWREFEDVYTLASSGQEVDEDLAKAAIEDGREHLLEKNKRRVWKQAFLGATDLLGRVEYSPSKHRPSIRVMGYERDDDEDGSLWYGLVKSLEGPQYAKNKFITKIVDASDHSGGGIAIEEGAVEDIGEFEKDYTDPTRIKVLKNGGANKIVPIAPAQAPMGADEMVAFSTAAIHDVTGAPPEIFGMADRQQANSLEQTRKQSAITSFAPMFDRLKSYRKEKGRLLRDYILAYLRDGRIVRKDGGTKRSLFPLTMETVPDGIDFEVKIDEQSTSPDNKARTLATLPILQAMFGGQLPPQMATRFIPYLDLPAKLISELMEDISQPNPQAEQQQQLQQMMIQLETAKTQAEIEETKAKTLHEMSQAQSEHAQGQKWLAEAGRQQQQAFNESLEPQFRAIDQLGGLMNGR